jgi:hypothetical protein
MTRKAGGRGQKLRCLLCGIAFIGAFLFDIKQQAISPRSAFAQSIAQDTAQDTGQDTASLSQLAQSTVKKGFKNIGLGEVCDRLHIAGACKAYQLNATVDAAESQKFGLPAGWQTSLNVLPQQGGTDIVITDHDEHIGYGYLIGADEGLRAVVVGLSSSGDGKNWRWKPGSVTSEIAQKFALEKAYWLAQIKDIQGLPDRKD